VTDFAVVGGGIVGVSAAAFLAEAGAAVELYERSEVAAGASGRNSGVLQHPFDPELLPLHLDSLEIYRTVMPLADDPAGILMLGRDQAPLAAVAADLRRDLPELVPEFVGPEDLARLEPSLAEGLSACRIETGYPVRPAAATRAMAERARSAGVAIREGVEVERVFGAGGARGGEAAVGAGRPEAGVLLAGGERRPAGAVLVAAGPWTPALVDPAGDWRPIVAVWGVVAEVELADPPSHSVEEAGVKAVSAGEPGSVFSLITADGVTGVGSSFAFQKPDHAAVGPRLRDAGAAFVPALRDAPLRSTRACARPQSRDGRPLVGELAEGLHVAAGHGPWGMSLGAGTGRLAADALLGRAEVPEALSARRFGGP
jgi:glycine/D-amino acid oxidase-like deaminating enzyme